VKKIITAVFEAAAAAVLVAGVFACSGTSSVSDGGVLPDGGGSVSYTLKFTDTAYSMYASIGGGTAHVVQLDTGSSGLNVPKGVVGSSAQISTTETCSVTYISSGKTLTGHKATGVVTLLGSTTAGDVNPPPSTTASMPFCAIDDPTFNGGMMGVGYGRDTGVPAQNVLLQLADVLSGKMHPGYVLSTRPSPNIQIGITAARSAGFQTVQLTASGNGDWVSGSLKGCLSLPDTPAFTKECGGMLVDTGVDDMILWGPADPTLGGIVKSGATSAPSGTRVQVTTQAGAMLDFTFTLGTGADTPSAVNIKPASGFSINTSRALIVDYDYMFDARAGLVGFQKM
jgi:hypothetical protein